MAPIPRIGVGQIRIEQTNIKKIDQIYTPEWLKSAPTVIPPAPPLTEQVGVPIIQMPGCVEAHERNTEDLKIEDPKGVKVFCDAGMPSFNPIDYDKNKLEYQYEAPVPPYKAPEPTTPPPPATPPDTRTPVPVTKQECPTREQVLKNPVGKILEGNKKITGYELVGKECLMVTENLTIPDQIIGNIPNAGMITTTGSIAVVATTSALLAKPVADLLLKLVKPTVKKVLKKIATLRGKNPPKESVRERRGQQRILNKAVRTLKGRE